MKIFPSLLAANLLNLENEIKNLEPYVDGWHIDIMDGKFVPNLGFFPELVKQISAIAQKQLWLHFMVEDVKLFIEKFPLRKGSIVSIHIESKFDFSTIIKIISEKKCSFSLAINPKTAVELVEPYLDLDIYQILVMSVEPGFSGQSFLYDVVHKVENLDRIRKQRNLKFAIALDGGINNKIMEKIQNFPVDELAVGSGIFNSKDRISAVKELRK